MKKAIKIPIPVNMLAKLKCFFILLRLILLCKGKLTKAWDLSGLFKADIKETLDIGLLFKVSICLLSIFKAFLPNSKAKPNVKAKKNINIITKPYIPLVYALTT